jgi:hypothetical protein
VLHFSARFDVRSLAWLAGALLALWAALSLAPFQLDDAFITYRYALRLARDGSLAYNPNGEAAEGFSSPLWWLALSLGAALFGPAALPQIAALLGFVSCVVGLGLAARLCDVAAETTPARAARLLPVPWLAVLPAAAYYASTGLEQPLFALCVVGCAAAVAGRAPPWVGSLLGALAPWVRPEGAFVAVASLAQHALMHRALPSLRSPAARTAIAALIGQLLLLGARLALFGQLVPNTYFAKEPSRAAGAAYLAALAQEPWVVPILVAALAIAWRAGPIARGLLGAGVLWLLVAWAEGGDWMPVGRFALPGLALLLIAPFTLERLSGLRRVFVSAVGVAGIALSLVELRAQAEITVSSLESNVHEQRFLTQWLERAGVRSVALVDIGELGFHGELEVIDLAGLTDAVIGHAPGGHLEKRFDLAYLFERRAPDVLVLRIDSPVPRNDERALGSVAGYAMTAVERRIASDARLDARYRLAFAILPADMREPFYGRAVFLRRTFAPRAPEPERLTYVMPLELE